MNAWSDARRMKAAETFRAAGVPHRRVEAWKYSDLRSAVGEGVVEAAVAAKWSLESDGVEVFDFASGEAPDWVKAQLGTAPDGIMGEATLAFAHAGFALRVKKSGEARVRFTEGQARVLIVVEDGAWLRYTQTLSGDGFQNIGSEFVIGGDAQLVHARLAEPSTGVRIEDCGVTVARGGAYRLHCANLGGELTRLDLHIALNGERAEAHLSGMTMLHGTAHADVTTHVDHAIGNTASTQLFKHVAGGKSRAVYQGKVTVREGADGSDSRQTAKALLLDVGAEADLKPELEIFADDVKCAHGAAVGDLDAESLFYLRSRGIPEDEARKLLIRAFLEEALADVEGEAIREFLWQPIEARL
jgi:Fe-S cluster assembly protein SufD